MAGRLRRSRRFARAATLAVCMGFAACGIAAGVEPLEAKRSEYDRLREQIRLSDERAAELAAEIAVVRKDQATLSDALVRSAAEERRLGGEIEAIEARLEPMKAREAELKRSLSARRAALAEVLGALQRMGLNPPPALMVRPEDALGAVRSAILLGAVVPGLRAETERLAADLARLGELAEAIRADRARLAEAVEGQLAEKKRLAMLMGEKERLQAAGEAALGAERRRSAELAAEAVDLKGLIAGLEREAAKAERAGPAGPGTVGRDGELAAPATPGDGRLAPLQPFGALLAALALPVDGTVALGFGDADGNGGVIQGNMVATQSGAIVTAPADAGVLYAGPFRSYGQVLILNAGDGYHVVLAGMDRISVAQGQSVLAGEPVGLMGDGRMASAAPLSAGGDPELYVEFRKDGRPVDPAPWWADGKRSGKRDSGRTGNGA